MHNSRPKKIDNLLQVIRECLRLERYHSTVHAAERQEERGIMLTDILYVLLTGWHEKSKDQFDEAFNSWNYAVRGRNLEEVELRVIISFNGEQDLLIITAFYLEKGG